MCGLTGCREPIYLHRQKMMTGDESDEDLAEGCVAGVAFNSGNGNFFGITCEFVCMASDRAAAANESFLS